MALRTINTGSLRKKFSILLAGLPAFLAAATLAVSCGEGGDLIEAERDKIKGELDRLRIYERGNLPDPPPQTVNGYYDIIRKAYRYVRNGEDREGRGSLPVIAAGDSISFMFDARIFTGNFDSSQTFYTNIESRQAALAGGNRNPVFSSEIWPTGPLKIKIGSDPQILKSVQSALLGCRAIVAEQEPEENEDAEEPAASDEVRIYLTSDIGFGTSAVFNVPGRSILVFELTDIKIIR